jgi:hypothetical protein
MTHSVIRGARELFAIKIFSGHLVSHTHIENLYREHIVISARRESSLSNTLREHREHVDFQPSPRWERCPAISLVLSSSFSMVWFIFSTLGSGNMCLRLFPMLCIVVNARRASAIQSGWSAYWSNELEDKRTPERRNRTPACFHAPEDEVSSEHQPDSPWQAATL